jgi:hypothetical protein
MLYPLFSILALLLAIIALLPNARREVVVPSTPQRVEITFKEKPPVTFDQVGYLKADHKVLAVYGQYHPYRRGRWLYYIFNNDVKVPLMYNNRDCLAEIGCDEIYDGDKVMFDGEEYMFKRYDTSLFR